MTSQPHKPEDIAAAGIPILTTKEIIKDYNNLPVDISEVRFICYEHFVDYCAHRDAELARLRLALELILKSEPTDENGDYCAINQPQFKFAQEALGKSGGVE